MLDTLLKIGEWQSQGKSKWDRFLDYPEVVTEDKRGNPITNYTLPIIFDLDNHEVIIDRENLEEYDDKKIVQTIPVKVKGGRNKAFYTSVPAIKLVQVYKTFFGAEQNTEIESGELLEVITRDYAELLTELQPLLENIFNLKDQFIGLTTIAEGKNIDIRTINESFDLNLDEKIVFIVTKVISTELGLDKPILFSEIPAYKSFLEQSYFGKEENSNNNKPTSKLCYASGEIVDDVKLLDLDARYSLNKMFVTSTQNYASLFDKNQFNINYQVSTENQKYLDYASDYLLNQGYKVRIANIDHVIIPQFLSNSAVDVEMALEGIQRESDLLFNLKRLDAFTKNIEDWLNEDGMFWINFVAFESDGNFFKSTEVIKDVSRFHFDKLNNTFSEMDEQFRKSGFVDWNTVMTGYDYDTKERTQHRFNFNSLYQIIPLRKEKEKKNKALDLFKTILENRKVDVEILYDYFTELILCHYYERYNSYTNVRKYGKDFFYFAVRDSVFKYLAFFQLLKKLKLIDMEEIITTEKSNQYDQLENDFFNKMNFNQEQRAMFYMGRMLNSVEYLQQGKNKTVIQKVNFNGLDKDSIQRLRIDLIEKAKQYNAMNKVIFTDQKFGKEFDFNEWNLNPQEAIFFMLTGYSFGAGKKSEINN